jgi:hypothetical protein
MIQKKQFWIPTDRLRRLVNDDRGCIASDSIMVDGRTIGLFYRDEPQQPGDSGWMFFSGDESAADMDDPTKMGFYLVNEVCNYDPSVIPFLGSPVGSAFRYDGSRDRFVPVTLAPP